MVNLLRFLSLLIQPDMRRCRVFIRTIALNLDQVDDAASWSARPPADVDKDYSSGHRAIA